VLSSAQDKDKQSKYLDGFVITDMMGVIFIKGDQTASASIPLAK
jgi:hypothetical protein